METYHRKRSKRVTFGNNETITFKRNEVCSVVDGAQEQAPPLARQPLHDTNNEVPHEEVELGSIYELYHKNLPPRTPVQLRSTRVVMVSEKTDLNVAIRYPSILSLRTYFSKGIMEMYPALDEKFVMGLKLASKVLLRQVPSQEFAAKKHLKEFWLVNPKSQSESNMKNDDNRLARELMSNKMLRWGVKRRVTYIGKHPNKVTTRKPKRIITPYTEDLPMDDTFIGQHQETSKTPSTYGLLIGDDTFNGKGDTFTVKQKETSDTPSTLGLLIGDGNFNAKGDTFTGKHKETCDAPSTVDLLIGDGTFNGKGDTFTGKHKETCDTFIGQHQETSVPPSTYGLLIGDDTFNGKGDTFTVKQKETSETPSSLGLLIGDGTFNGKHKETCDAPSTVGLVTCDTFRKHNETSDTPSTLGLIIYDQEVKNQQENGGDDIEEVEEEIDHETDQEENDDEAKEVEEEEEEEQEEEDLEKELKSTRILRKRKKAKQVKHVWRQVNKKPMKKCRKLVIRNPTDRWSKERYMAAEFSLLEAMQEKKAMIGNPISRPALRVEARKRIGDTGLLDHLLKHVANKVAPGGNLRFRRSHNADGAMEYWLEDADLLKIRKDAGVTDPLWIPPPGWKPGDSPTQDPIMAKELNHLKEEISFIKREYLPKKQVEEEMAGLRREILELTSKNKQEQSQSIVVSEVVDTSPLQVMDICNFLLHSESETSDVDNSVLKKGQCKKQLVVISEILKKIQARMQASEVDEETTQMEAARSPKAGTLLITATASSNAQEKVADENEGIAPPKQPAGVDQEKSEKSGHVSSPAAQTQAPAPPEGKAAKIERLKSGFRLCRPQGTFLWPNMVNPTNITSSASNMSLSQVTLQVEDPLQVVPTPPSVNSSTPPLPPYHHHHHINLASPPVKPVPERRPVSVSSLSEGHPQPTTLLNLNDIPTNPSSQHIVTTTTTITPTIKLQQPFGANMPAGSKKRKSPSSATSGSSDTPSCLSNTGNPAWLADSGRHPQWF